MGGQRGVRVGRGGGGPVAEVNENKIWFQPISRQTGGGGGRGAPATRSSRLNQREWKGPSTPSTSVDDPQWEGCGFDSQARGAFWVESAWRLRQAPPTVPHAVVHV